MDAALQTMLEKADLPRRYPNLGYYEQQAERMRVLTQWYDKDTPHVLCKDVELFLAAHYLWAEYYIKPEPYNHGIYHFEDPLCKYEMVRMAMSDPKIPSEAGKSVVHAPRRLGKTQTLIQEMCSLIAISRPFSEILVSEANATRTEEEIKKLKVQIENNTRIHEDFGGPGELFPAGGKAAQAWRDNRLDFLHQPRCSIMGHSISSAQRGRGPIFGIIDDPETDEDSFSKKWRKDFFSKLFSTYLPMFHKGGKILWIGTVIHGQSCLAQALQGLSQKDDKDKEGELDHRFDDWHKRRFGMIETDEDGNLYSQQPSRMTVEAFEIKKQTMGLQAVMAELQGLPINPGEVAFNYDPMANGYMRAIDPNGKEYFLNFETGEQIPWEAWISSLTVFGAGDLADGLGVEADPGALVFLGVDSEGRKYVLDAFEKRCYAEDLVKMAYTLSEQWAPKLFGWEKVSLSTVICRLARRYVDELRQAGKTPPAHRDIENTGKNKVARILTMIPLVNGREIKFPYFREFTDAEGNQHKAATVPRKRYIQTLIDQIVECTDEGVGGHDDLIDALEMAVRLAGESKAPEYAGPANPNDVMVRKWEDTGLPISKAQLPVQAWTPTMWDESLLLDVFEEELDYDYD